MKRDEKHEKWRKEHGLPIDYRTRRDAQRIASKVEEIISRNQREYMWTDG